MLEGMVVANGPKYWKKFDYPAMDEQMRERHIFKYATGAYHMSGGSW